MTHPKRLAALAALVLGLASLSQAAPVALGFQLGDANEGGFSGLTVRVGEDRTIEGIFAYSENTLILNGNYLVHGHSLFRQDPIDFVKFYAGFGVGAWNYNGDHDDHDNTGAWIQVPLGVDFRFSIPIEATLYIAPGIDVIPETQGNWHGALGIRYWFR